MYHSRQQFKVRYSMTAPSAGPSLPKSRGHSLFDRQAQLHAADADQASENAQKSISDIRVPLPTLRPSSSISSVTAQPPHQYQNSPVAIHRRLPLISSESYSHSNQSNSSSVQLLSVHPRPELTYIKEVPAPITTIQPAEKLLETDFPLVEDSSTTETVDHTRLHAVPSELTCTAVVEQAFDYLKIHDDDDDVILRTTNDKQAYDSDSFDDDDNDDDDDDSVDTIDLDANTGGVHALSAAADLGAKRNDHAATGVQGKVNTHSSHMASSSRGTISEDYDSDFDNSSHEDDEPTAHKDSVHELDEEEQHNELILRKQQILSSIVKEWSRKEESYNEQLKMMDQHLSQISIPTNLKNLIQHLTEHHRNIYAKIQDLHNREYQPADLTQQLTNAVETLTLTLPLYDEYIKMNLAAIRKSLEKRSNAKELAAEELLSIPPKQFLQILSQVQDLYQTAQSFESSDDKSGAKLYDFALECKKYASRQDENINKIILKSEDVAMMVARASRDRCRLILYPDAIVCCHLKTKLLASPKYALHWFIPVIDLQWFVPQSPVDDEADTNDLKSHLHNAYSELEKNPKTNNATSSRISKSIRRQESEYNLAQSKLQLVLSSDSRPTVPLTILFSSNYQRQDWIDLIDRTKQDLLQRSSAELSSTTHHQRLNDSLIQKRLDLVKPYSHDSITNELPSSLRSPSQSSPAAATGKTYSGTLIITIHSIHGSALCNPSRQHHALTLPSAGQQQLRKNYQFYVAVEIDSYNSFYPYAKTAKQIIQQEESVEFRKEKYQLRAHSSYAWSKLVFQIELEYSLAFCLLIYRVDTSAEGSSNSLQRESCIGKFHRRIESALNECAQNPNAPLCIASPSGDLQLKVSLKHAKRQGTFRRQPSKRSQAVFAKSIERLTSTPNGHIDGIPRIVVKCIEIVNRDGLEETGIYRVCCVTSDLQKLRRQFDHDYDSGERMLATKNVHVAANLLKLFFRELPEPLFTVALYKRFLDAIQLTDIDNQRITLLNVLDNLPADHRRILFYLLDHLIRVSEHSSKNMMHLDNLAVVFGPTLMHPSKLITTTYYSGSNQRLNAATNNSGQTDLDQMSSELQGSMCQCQVVLACLKLRRDGILK